MSLHEELQRIEEIPFAQSTRALMKRADTEEQTEEMLTDMRQNYPALEALRNELTDGIVSHRLTNRERIVAKAFIDATLLSLSQYALTQEMRELFPDEPDG